MNEDALKRQEELYEIASLDAAYLVWSDTYEKYAEQFKAYADAQPKEIRDMLWYYTTAGRLMKQRLVNLACIHMDFIDREE